MRTYMLRLAAYVAIAAGVWLGPSLPARADHHGTHVIVGPTDTPARVGPSYLYPDPTLNPGATNPDITQATIKDTIGNPNWSTKTIRPPAAYTTALKQKQLATPRYLDKNPSHYEEDHLISLELGGNPKDEKNLWPEPWGTPDAPLTSTGPFPAEVIGAKAKDHVENALHKEVCAGTLTLKEAQDIIATDWFKYYKEKILK